jgi:hypothetical protein
MPYGLDAHVLTVDANVLHKVDTGNLDNLFSMWAGESSAHRGIPGACFGVVARGGSS